MNCNPPNGFENVKKNFGFGCMRLPMDGDKVDYAEFTRMVDRFMAEGFNYFDTARVYIDGQSETALRDCLVKRYPRESFHLTTKFPGYDRNNFPKVKEIFAKQLEKLQTEYFDFYLFHNVCEYNIENYLNPAFGVKEYLVSERAAGRIKHLGYSDHGGIECFKRFLAAYEDVIEFCQIQLNWLDWDFQEAKEKVRILNEKKIPIIVMEPLRGGTLVEPAGGAEASFRFLQSIPGVVTILSGMSNLEQMQENIRIFETDAPMDDAAKAVLFEKAKKMTEGVPCTACRYCQPCPMGVEIPRIFTAWNQYRITKNANNFKNAYSEIPNEAQAHNCVACGACMEQCPQHIQIPDLMTEIADAYEALK